MGKPYSMDLRERVVAAVMTGGLSCNQAAKQFGVGISTAINWMKRLRGDRQRHAWQGGRLQAKVDLGRARGLAFTADPGRRVHLARARPRVRRARAEGGLPLSLGVRPCREAKLQKKAWWLASAIVPTWRGGGRSG
jgi:transposase-like protein